MPSPREVLQAYSTVILTGGSSGIGKSFIERLGILNPAIEFCNLSRTEPRDISPQLKLRHFACDLSRPDELRRSADAIVELLNSAQHRGRLLLINNSGFGIYGDFPGGDSAAQLEMVDLNVRAVLDLTARLMAPLKQRGGAILNVASTAAFQPTPHFAVYGASKAFLLHWSLALQQELAGSGVHVLAVCPGPTSSNFFRRAGLRPATNPRSKGMTCDEVADLSLRALARGRSQVITGWRNRLGAIAGSTLPPAVSARFAKKVIERNRLNRLKS